MRPGLLERIENEIENSKAGKISGIQLKLNSLLDEEFIEALYRASQAGVQVDLIIRGISSIKPGVTGLSENIRVRSILGRFLEHSRIYHFKNGGADEYWIGSADLMQRNLDRRVESLVRIEKAAHKIMLQEILDISMDPKTSSWHQQDTNWKRINSGDLSEELVDIQSVFIKRSKKGRK